MSEEKMDKIYADCAGQENEEALDKAYQDGYQDGYADADLENSDELDAARKEGYDEGYAEALENAVAALERLQ
jgi:hypothetical protein|nr:MAG TPA: hypothetical protein [Caudoviricetes sp.]